jgi:hypothetical protein
MDDGRRAMRTITSPDATQCTALAMQNKRGVKKLSAPDRRTKRNVRRHVPTTLLRVTLKFRAEKISKAEKLRLYARQRTLKKLSRT